jgi:transposase
MDTTPEVAAQVVACTQLGHSQRFVAQQLNLSRSAVRRVYQRFQDTGSFNRRPGAGRRRYTSERDDRFIESTSLTNRRLNAIQIQRQLRDVRGVVVNEWTVTRRLQETNLTPRRPATGPKLTAAHRQTRLRFAREHLNWTLDHWMSLLFSDETRICLNGKDGRGRVYRRPGERFAQCCIDERVSYGGGSCMIWGGISVGERTEAVFIVGAARGRNRRSLTAAWYVGEILADHVVPYAGFVGDQSMLMHDNAKPHTARITREYLVEVGVRVLEWPACSPDLNPIEHLWDELKRRVRAGVPVGTSIPELMVAVEEEWHNIPQERIVNLIRSMPNRMQAVVRARGGNTRY